MISESALPNALDADGIELNLHGKVALITGASRGLGRKTAVEFARLGASVCLLARDETRLDSVVDEIERAGGSAIAVPGSVSDDGCASRSIEAIADRWERLDIVVNNAGISPAFLPPEKIDLDLWKEVLDVNVTGTFSMAKASVDLLTETGGGSIINLSSVHGKVGHERLTAYAASKGAVEAMTRSLALAWADRGIRVNTVAPGYVETEMTVGLRDNPRWSQHLLSRIPAGRFATTDDVVASVAFLASDLSRYITGSTIAVDGGWTAQ